MTTAKSGIALEFDNLTLGYNRHPAVHHLSASVEKGKLLAVVGPNGAGKSTLLKSIAGELAPLEGTVRFGEGSPSVVAYLPQRRECDLSFPISVREMVTAGLWREIGALSRLTTDHIECVAQALELVRLNEFADCPIGHLSGGQIQRALFARILVQKAPVVLLDEPFTALDVNATKLLTDCLHALQMSGTTVIAVLHNMRQVKDHFPHTMLLARELVAYATTEEVFTPENLLRAQHMQESFDDMAQVCQFSTGVSI